MDGVLDVLLPLELRVWSWEVEWCLPLTASAVASAFCAASEALAIADPCLDEKLQTEC